MRGPGDDGSDDPRGLSLRSASHIGRRPARVERNSGPWRAGALPPRRSSRSRRGRRQSPRCSPSSSSAAAKDRPRLLEEGLDFLPQATDIPSLRAFRRKVFRSFGRRPRPPAAETMCSPIRGRVAMPRPPPVLSLAWRRSLRPEGAVDLHRCPHRPLRGRRSRRAPNPGIARRRGLRARPTNVSGGRLSRSEADRPRFLGSTNQSGERWRRRPPPHSISAAPPGSRTSP